MSKPLVELTHDEAATADQVIEALGKLGTKTSWLPLHKQVQSQVFVRGGVLVAILGTDDPDNSGQLTIRGMHPATLRERITQACQLYVKVRDANGEHRISPRPPPKWLVEAIYNRGFYGGCLSPLFGLVQAPTIRTDGSILQTRGYDKSSGLFYSPLGDFPVVPANPTRDDARAAADLLGAVVKDFPFLADADRSAWLSMVLSMIGRTCWTGCCPLFAITANLRGSGKTLLSDSASLIAYGRPASRRTFAPADSEMAKVITTVAIEATPCVLLDNLASKLSGASLDSVLTGQAWTGRVLGQSKTTGELPIRTVWVATGNNLLFGSDVARRVVPIRLESSLENPEERTDFEAPDLLRSVNHARPRLAVAALTILRAYFAAGCPAMPGGAFGSFEAWSRIIRGAIVWAGLADPLATRETAKASDDSAERLGMLVAGLREADPDGIGLTIREIERLVGHRPAPDTTPTCPALQEAIAMICGERFNARKVSYYLRSLLGRVVDGVKIEARSAGGNLKRWFLAPGNSPLKGETTPKLTPKLTPNNDENTGKTDQRLVWLVPNSDPEENSEGYKSGDGLAGTNLTNPEAIPDLPEGCEPDGAGGVLV